MYGATCWAIKRQRPRSRQDSWFRLKHNEVFFIEFQFPVCYFSLVQQAFQDKFSVFSVSRCEHSSQNENYAVHLSITVLGVLLQGQLDTKHGHNRRDAFLAGMAVL